MLQAQDEKILKNHLRDFLVQTKEFSSGDNSELYYEDGGANHQGTFEQLLLPSQSSSSAVYPTNSSHT
jgi:hypothetical protein